MRREVKIGIASFGGVSNSLCRLKVFIGKFCASLEYKVLPRASDVPNYVCDDRYGDSAILGDH